MLRRAGLVAALSALLLPAAAAGPATADAAKRSKRLPVVTKITPKRAFVGETLTIRGRHFRPGIKKNTVAFKRRGARAVFVKASKGTRKLLKVELPKRLEKVLVVRNGTPVPTRLRVRVISFRFGRKFTSAKRSPFIGPEKPPAPPAPPKVDPDADCDGDGLINRTDTDDDNDLLTDAEEARYKLDACGADSDGDGVEDGYEYASARDLNDDEHQGAVNENLPYPEKRPYPNPLDGQDGGVDHDGDRLTLKEEYDLWRYTIANGSPRTIGVLSYSAGMQHSVYSVRADGRRTPALAAVNYPKQVAFQQWAASRRYDRIGLAAVRPRFQRYAGDADDAWWYAPRTQYANNDMDRDGVVSDVEKRYYSPDDDWLTDYERDEDADGLPNGWESHGCMIQAYWTKLYDKETPYPLSFAGTRLDDPDTDGDLVRDGVDDQDNDDVPNMMECSRVLAMADVIASPPAGWNPADLPTEAFVNPFNPCVPHELSRACNRYPTINEEWAPFNPDDDYFLIKN
jgi:hypothetical protein